MDNLPPLVVARDLDPNPPTGIPRIYPWGGSTQTKAYSQGITE